jgi:hypothetical protein
MPCDLVQNVQHDAAPCNLALTQAPSSAPVFEGYLVCKTDFVTVRNMTVWLRTAVEPRWMTYRAFHSICLASALCLQLLLAEYLWPEDGVLA